MSGMSCVRWTRSPLLTSGNQRNGWLPGDLDRLLPYQDTNPHFTYLTYKVCEFWQMFITPVMHTLACCLMLHNISLSSKCFGAPPLKKTPLKWPSNTTYLFVCFGPGACFTKTVRARK